MSAVLKDSHIVFVFCSMELGGAERQGLHLAKYLIQQGAEVSVVSTNGNVGLAAEYCREHEIPVFEQRFFHPCRKISLMRDLFGFWRLLRRLRPDVLIPMNGAPNVGCGLVFKLIGARAFIWGQRNVHDVKGDWLERIAFRNATGVICNALHAMSYLEKKFGKITKPKRVVHNGLELAVPKKSPEEWRSQLGIESDAVVVTMLANLRPAKDHATLLRAWNSIIHSIEKGFPAIHLVLAGARQQTAAEVEGIASELGLLGRSVHIVGQVKDVAGLLNACDIGVLTSPCEGLSNAIIEYMASGLPVVATENEGNREALGHDYQVPLVQQGDEKDVAEKLKMLLLNPVLREQIGHRNREAALEKFSIAKMCENMTEFIEEQLPSRN